MMNVKLFLRSQPLRFPTKPQTNDDEKKKGIIARITGNIISKFFKVTTRDTIKEYRIFSHSFFRLRVNRVLRAYLEALNEYRWLSLGEKAYPIAQGAFRQTQLESVAVLRTVADYCKNKGITYWAWSGTLLGTAHNNALPAWAKQASIIMFRNDYEAFRRDFTSWDGAGENRVQYAIMDEGAILRVGKENSVSGVAIFPCDRYDESWKPDDIVRQYHENIDKKVVAELCKRNEPETLHAYYDSLRKKLWAEQTGSLIGPGCDYPSYCIARFFFNEEYYLPTKEGEIEGIPVPLPNDHDLFLTALYGNYMRHLGDPATICY